MTKKKEWIKKNTISISTAASRLKVKSNAIMYQIKCGNIESRDNRIHKSDLEIIQKQRSKYIGITEFIKEHKTERFNARLVQNRNKYIDFLEINEFFGARRIESKNMLFVDQNTEEVFLTREDAEYIDFKCTKFFKEFGYTDEEKIYRMINNKYSHRLTMKYINKYIECFDDGNNKYTPTMTSFVEVISSVGDIRMLTDEEILVILETSDALRTKELIVGFIKYVSGFESVKYNRIE